MKSVHAQVEVSPGLLVVVYEEDGGKWVEVASNFNLDCPITPEIQRHIGNVFMPAELFLRILDDPELRKECIA